MGEDKKRNELLAHNRQMAYFRRRQYRRIENNIRKNYGLLDKAVNANFRAKIIGRPFDDCKVTGIAQKVLAEINKLPKHLQRRLGDVSQYAQGVTSALNPLPAESYAKPETLQMARLRSEVAGLYSRVG